MVITFLANYKHTYHNTKQFKKNVVTNALMRELYRDINLYVAHAIHQTITIDILVLHPDVEQIGVECVCVKSGDDSLLHITI
jgi:hypothetical protein